MKKLSVRQFIRIVSGAGGVYKCTIIKMRNGCIFLSSLSLIFSLFFFIFPLFVDSTIYYSRCFGHKHAPSMLFTGSTKTTAR